MDANLHKVDIYLAPEAKPALEDTISNEASGRNSSLESFDRTADVNEVYKRRWALPVTVCRILARLVDMLWQSVVTWWLINALVTWSDLFLHYQVLILLFVGLPIVLLIDLVVQGLLGSTPGKKLLGVQAFTWPGDVLTLRDSFERNFLLWRYGFLFGLPLMPFSLLGQLLRLRKGERTQYDDHLHFRVGQEDRPVIVNLATSVIALIILTLSVSHIVFGKSIVNDAGAVLAEWIPIRADSSTFAHAVPDSIVEQSSDAHTLADENTVGIDSAPAPRTSYTLVTGMLPSTDSPPYKTQEVADVPTATLDSVATDRNPIWWTNTENNLSIEIEAGWDIGAGTSDLESRFNFRDTDIEITLRAVDEGVTNLEQMVNDYLERHPEFSATSNQQTFAQDRHPGLRLMPSLSSMEDANSSVTDTTIEWLKVDEKYYQMTLLNISADKEGRVEQLRQSLWRTFP